MTDELDPGKAPGSPDDETTRTALPSPPPVATTPVAAATTAAATTPTAPLTPASRSDSGTGTPVYENDVAWSTAGPVKATGSGTPRRPRSRLRWAAAIAVVALVVGASAAAAALLTGASSTATVLGYVPDATVVYGEVRLDLPGDQKQAVGSFLSKFPGFADQASLDSKLDEVLDDLVREASNGEQTYTGNIKAWFDGELAFAVGPLPPAKALTGNDAAAMGSFRMLGLMSVKDPTAAAAWFDAAFKKAGATPTTETHDGTAITVFPEESGVTTAYALVGGEVAVFGDLTSVKAAIDTDGNSGFAKEDGPKAALDSSSGDHVGFMYLALRPLMDWSTSASNEITVGGVATEVISDTMLKLVPDWGAYWLSFESDALVAEAVAPRPEKAIGSTENRTSDIVEHIPSTAIVASVSNDAGKSLGDALDVYGSEPGVKSMLDELDKGLGLVGGADAALGWIGDTAIVVNDAEGTPEGGLIIAPTDKEAPGRLLTALKTFLALGGSQQGITVREETHNGTTITIVGLGDLSKLAGGDAAALPPGVALDGNLEVAIAVTDDVVVIGTGAGFVKHVLDTEPSSSLASSDGYKELASRAGKGTGATFVALDAIRGMIEKSMAKEDPAGFTRYQAEVQPYLEPLDSLFVGSSIDGDLSKSVLIISVQ